MRSLLLTAIATLALAGCQPAGDEAFGQRVRAYLLDHPEVLEEAINKLNETRARTASADSLKLLASNRPALVDDPRDPVVGDPKAPITVVEFFDYRCGFCKSAAPDVLALVEANKDVRLVMKEMPILADAETGAVGVSGRAARVALAAYGQGKYLPVHRALMAERGLDAVAVDRIARENGVDVSGLESPAVTDHLADIEQLARTLGIDGTPAFIIGDTTVAGANIEAIRQAVAAQRRKS